MIIDFKQRPKAAELPYENLLPTSQDLMNRRDEFKQDYYDFE
jgi:hypothetical protein